jgi:hypothetical protein
MTKSITSREEWDRMGRKAKDEVGAIAVVQM